ncbi:MAG TPA: hypothetical protein VLE03_10045 [Nitrospiraceae bacterium]|nr:hypothetical protein [Nitrospiraceae bacterium]
MTDAILQSYREVEQAMERFTLVLQEHVNVLQRSEGPESDKLVRMTHGYKAMRDSAMIYLSYAKYVAHGMPASDEMVQDEIQG